MRVLAPPQALARVSTTEEFNAVIEAVALSRPDSGHAAFVQVR